MNKQQLEAEKAKLADEKKVLQALKKLYEEAAKDVQGKIHIHTNKINIMLTEWDELDDEKRSILQSQIYQKKFQLQLKAQIDDVVKKLVSGQYKTIEDFLNDSFTTAFLGTMYDLHGQGIPLIVPIDRKAMLKAVELDPKLSKKLYGSYMEQMKDSIRAEVSRGIATADSYEHIARNISNKTNQGFNKTMRIVRTEGHRIQVEAAFEQQQKAKKAGADIVKQWDSTLDGKTRPTHRKLDGQLRELDEPFEVGGHKAMYPSGFGRAEEDINCRCALLQRARWALDDDELQVLKDRAEYFGLDKADTFNDFKKKYLEAAEVFSKAEKQAAEQVAERTTFVPAKTIEEANEYAKQFVQNSMMARTFKGQIDYKGISLENANEINLALTKVFNQVGVQKITGIKVVSPTSAAGKKAFKSGSDAVFSYNPVEHGIFINKDILKNRKAFDDYVKKGAESWELVMGNLDKLSDKAKEMALRYKKAGRDLVDGKTIEGMFTHELGHHVQWTLLDVATGNKLGDRWEDYAGNISGYATATKSEYWAESFVAYMRGETDILDPEYVAALKKKGIASSKKSGIMQATNEFIKIIPEAKLVSYALDPLKDENKAKAFELALGYTKDNYQDLKKQVMEKVDESKLVPKGDIGYGMRYECVIEVDGLNGKKAKVLTAWIEDGEDKRLTSIYVTDKDVTK